MTQHHPDINTLTEFATGTLDPAQAIAVKAHLHFCPHCRQQVQQLEQLGGILLEQSEPAALEHLNFDSLMNTIDQLPPERLPAQSNEALPGVVVSLLKRKPLVWRKFTGGLKEATLNAGPSKHEIALHKIKASGRVPKHDHDGMEITVVLQGSFSDEDGLYQAGDFLIKQPGQVHQPVSACNEDCLCLSVLQGPVRLTGLMGKFINPFIRLQKKVS